MQTLLTIIGSGLRMALQECWANKVRTFLSLFGITIGIFCIIGVLSSINSLNRTIKKDLDKIGNNTLFISKWEWGNTSKEFWKYAARPAVSLQDLIGLQQYNTQTQYLSYTVTDNISLTVGTKVLQPVAVYATTAQFIPLQNIAVGYGRPITITEYDAGNALCLLGYNNACALFATAQNALQQKVTVKGKQLIVVGVLTAYGKNLLDGWDFDNCAIVPYQYYNTNLQSRKMEPILMAKSKPNISPSLYASGLRQQMRMLRKLTPTDADNFSLNTTSVFTERINSITKYVQLGGTAIALCSLIVGAFGIANIMFVTVRERTKIIGLKKALGATSTSIRAEFLMESAMLCVIGGVIGLLLLYGITLLLNQTLSFAIVISLPEILLSILLCTVIGTISGYVPANNAAKLPAVVALRS